MVNTDSLKSYTRDDINDLVKIKGKSILIFEGKVYDSTDFNSTHPGGAKYIEDYIGKDITKVFYEEEHTKVARRMLHDMLIGTLENQSEDQDSQDTHHDDSFDENELDSEEWRKKVNPSKGGTVWQVFQNVNNEEYLDLINNPKHLAPNEEHVMFENSFLDFFSHIQWWQVLAFWGPFAMYQAYNGYMANDFCKSSFSSETRILRKL